MISFQEAVEKFIEEVEEELDSIKCTLNTYVIYNVADHHLTNCFARLCYYHELLEALKGVRRLEKSYSPVTIWEQWKKEKGK